MSDSTVPDCTAPIAKTTAINKATNPGLTLIGKPTVQPSIRKTDRLLPCSISVIDHHVRCDILLEAERRPASGLVVRAPPSAHPPSTIRAVRTRTATPITGDGLLDDLLLDFGAGLRNLRGLGCCEAQSDSQQNQYESSNPSEACSPHALNLHSNRKNYKRVPFLPRA